MFQNIAVFYKLLRVVCPLCTVVSFTCRFVSSLCVVCYSEASISLQYRYKHGYIWEKYGAKGVVLVMSFYGCSTTAGIHNLTSSIS